MALSALLRVLLISFLSIDLVLGGMRATIRSRADLPGAADRSLDVRFFTKPSTPIPRRAPREPVATRPADV